MSNKATTCATVLLTKDRQDILMGSITLSRNKFDLPKGRAEPNESHLDAAIRELKEETGLIISATEYEEYLPFSLQNYSYNHEKNISIFFLYDKDGVWLKDLSQLKCNSYFRKKNGRIESCQAPEFEENSYNIFPEFTGYALFNPHQFMHSEKQSNIFLNKPMAKIFLDQNFKYRFHVFMRYVRENYGKMQNK